MKRRHFLSQIGTVALAASVSGTALGQGRARGDLRAEDFGFIPDAPNDQSAPFQRLLDEAARAKSAVHLPGGDFVLSDIRLPPGTVLTGVPGHTRFVHGGSGYLLRASDADTITIDGISIAATRRPMTVGAEGLIDLRGVDTVSITRCMVANGGANGIYLERCGGRLRDNTLAGASQFAIFAVNSRGLTITGNTVRACGNGGIVVHRGSSGRDGSIVTENRISNTDADNGGTGQWGNAINVFRADDVIIANNMIADSAFSAIRGNSSRGLQIIGNNCRASGETAIYAEFAFENAVVSGNIVDGAANGISVTNFDHGGRAGTVSGNIVRNLSLIGPYVPDFPSFGVGIGVEADTTVTGNMIEGAPWIGINAGWGAFLRDVVISGNTVRDSRFGIGVSAAEGAGRALVRQNVIAARERAISAHLWGKPIGPDLAIVPASAPPNILVSENAAT